MIHNVSTGNGDLVSEISESRPTPDGLETKFAFVDGRDALAYLIIMPNGDAGVLIDAQANGISKPQAAYILRHVADQWDPKPALRQEQP